MELAFATLHQLCSPVLDHLDRLPGPQRDALRTVFGLSAGPPPDRFLVGLAALTCSPRSPGRRPLLCSSTMRSGWTGLAVDAGLRRPTAAGRVGRPALRGARTGRRAAGAAGARGAWADTGDARALLSTVIPVHRSTTAPRSLVAETHGNPLAMLELPRGLAADPAPVGFGAAGGRRCRGGSRRASCARSRPCRRTRGCSCCWWPPSRPTIRCWCGGRRSASASSRPRPSRRYRGPPHDQRPGDLPASAGALGRLPFGIGAGAPRRPPALAEVTDARPMRTVGLGISRWPPGAGRGGRRRARTVRRPSPARGGLAAAAAFLQLGRAVARP